jgi:hypothetical protein
MGIMVADIEKKKFSEDNLFFIARVAEPGQRRWI